MTKSWQIVGGESSFAYKAFHWLRGMVNRRLVRFLIADGENAPMIALEAGSGPAQGASLMAEKENVFSVAVDIDIEALREARRRDPDLPAVVADMTDMPFPENTFDLVWNSSTVEHLADTDAAVRELARVAKDDGRVFVGVPYAWGPLFFQPIVSGTDLGEWLGPVFTQRRLKELFTRAGLIPVRAIKYFLWFFIGIEGRKKPPPEIENENSRRYPVN